MSETLQRGQAYILTVTKFHKRSPHNPLRLELDWILPSELFCTHLSKLWLLHCLLYQYPPILQSPVNMHNVLDIPPCWSPVEDSLGTNFMAFFPGMIHSKRRRKNQDSAIAWQRLSRIMPPITLLRSANVLNVDRLKLKFKLFLTGTIKFILPYLICWSAFRGFFFLLQILGCASDLIYVYFVLDAFNLPIEWRDDTGSGSLT